MWFDFWSNISPRERTRGVVQIGKKKKKEKKEKEKKVVIRLFERGEVFSNWICYGGQHRYFNIFENEIDLFLINDRK